MRFLVLFSSFFFGGEGPSWEVQGRARIEKGGPRGVGLQQRCVSRTCDSRLKGQREEARECLLMPKSHALRGSRGMHVISARIGKRGASS